MAFEFKLPDLGEGLNEAQMVEWLVEEGDQVEEDQPLCTVETDKADVEIPSPRAGRVLKIAVPEGEVARVGDVLVVIGDAEEPEAAEEGAPAAEAPAPRREAERPRPAGAERALATPAARRLARDLGVDVDGIEGTGPDGRVTKDDIRAAALGPPERAPERPREERTIPFTGIRRRIAENMARSAREMAQVTHFDEADVSRLMELFAELKPEAADDGVRLTPSAFFMAAAALALREHPVLNATLDEEEGVIRLLGHIHIAFAVATDRGLLAPVVRDADRKGLFQLAREMEELGRKTREGQASRQELVGGTFTLTNVGSVGGIASTPLVNPPQVAILGVHEIQDRPVVRQGEIVIRKMVYLAVSYDHRILDGADAAAFTNTLIRYVETPGLLLAKR